MKIKRIRSIAKTWIWRVAGFFKASMREWIEDKALRQAAALAFYSIFSLAPLLVIAIAVAGFFFGEQAVQGEIVAQLEEFVGYEGAVFVENMLREARVQGTGLGATLISLGTVLFGALVIFSALQDALNTIWGVEPAEHTGILYTIKQRLFAFLMILIVGIVVIASLLVSTILSVVEAYWQAWFDVDLTLGLWRYADRLVPLVFFTGVFGVVYKMLPDVRMAWKDVWLGAFMTSILFMIGEFGISTYLTYASPGSVFGAAGTLAVLLIWIYYSWVIVLIGAEMTQVYARKYGSGIRPGKNAVLRVDMTRKVQGRLRVIRETADGGEEEIDFEDLIREEVEKSIEGEVDEEAVVKEVAEDLAAVKGVRDEEIPPGEEDDDEDQER